MANSYFNGGNIEPKNISTTKNNGFFDILKLRMGEYREFKNELKNQRAVETFQNMMMNADTNELSKSTIRNTPFDENVTVDETKYKL